MRLKDKTLFNEIMFAVCCITAAIALTFDKETDVACFNDLINAKAGCMGIGPAVVLLAIIYFAIKNKNMYRLKVNRLFAVTAIILSQCYWAGYRLDQSNEILVLNAGVVLFWLELSIGWTFIMYSLAMFLSSKFNEIYLSEEGISKSEKQKWTITSFFFCAIIWAIYYIMFFPGVVSTDSFVQISQALGFEPLSNHHPFMHTLLAAVFLKPAYALLGNTEIGIAAFLLFQLLIMSLIIAYAQSILCEIGAGKKLRTGILLFYAVNPLFGMYSVTMWKDVWMGMMLMLFLLLIVKVVYLGDSTIKTDIFLALSVMGVFFSKATGIAMILFALIALIVLIIKEKEVPLRTAASIAAAMALCLMIQSMAINSFGVIPSESRESKSVPLQQIARTVKECGDELSNEEKEAINEILPYDELAANYNPRVSDPVKNTFKEENFDNNKGKYIKLWMKLGIRYPSVYIKSFFYNTYGYWYPDANYWVVSSQSYALFFTEEYKEYVRSLDISSEKDTGNYNKPKDYSEKRTNRLEMIFTVRRLPGLSLLFSIGAYFWAYLLIAVYVIINRKLKMAVPLSIAFAVFVSCLISPVYCEMRYGYPAVIIIPVVIALCFIKDPRNE